MHGNVPARSTASHSQGGHGHAHFWMRISSGGRCSRVGELMVAHGMPVARTRCDRRGNAAPRAHALRRANGREPGRFRSFVADRGRRLRLSRDAVRGRPGIDGPGRAVARVARRARGSAARHRGCTNRRRHRRGAGDRAQARSSPCVLRSGAVSRCSAEAGPRGGTPQAVWALTIRNAPAGAVLGSARCRRGMVDSSDHVVEAPMMLAQRGRGP